MDAVRAIDVRMTAREEHGRVARSATVQIPVRSGIVVVVGLDLDDHAAHATDRELDADQIGCDLVHRAAEERRRHSVARLGLPRVVVEEARQRKRRGNAADDAKHATRNDGEADRGERREDAGLDIAEVRRACDLRELDPGQPSQQVGRGHAHEHRRSEHCTEESAQPATASRTRAGRRRREAERCDRDPPRARRDGHREPLAPDREVQPETSEPISAPAYGAA